MRTTHFRQLPALSPEARKRLGGEPTPSQERALHVALKDVAQGAHRGPGILTRPGAGQRHAQTHPVARHRAPGPTRLGGADGGHAPGGGGAGTEALEAAQRTVAGTHQGAESVIAGFLDDLYHDPDGVRDMLGHYTVVLASTCQQSASTGMAALKEEQLVFDSVIVDEAARANPLDLFIPLALGRRRIVLVGDHRQLPHLLEPDVESQLEESVSMQTREALKKSLFERLFHSLRERTRLDGIPRVVTLDTQYRMHPVLGDFVSRVFYEHHEDPRIHSGRPAEEFTHGLRDYGDAVAAFIAVPRDQGSERGGQSKCHHLLRGPARRAVAGTHAGGHGPRA